MFWILPSKNVFRTFQLCPWILCRLGNLSGSTKNESQWMLPLFEVNVAEEYVCRKGSRESGGKVYVPGLENRWPATPCRGRRAPTSLTFRPVDWRTTIRCSGVPGGTNLTRSTSRRVLSTTTDVRHGMPRHAFHLPCSHSIFHSFLLSFPLLLLSLYPFISSFQKDIRGICTEIKHRLHGGTTAAGIIGSSLISDTKSSVQRFVVVPRNCFNINLRYLWIAISLSAYINASLPLRVFMNLVFMTSFFYDSCISYCNWLIYSDIDSVFYSIFYFLFDFLVIAERIYLKTDTRICTL